MLRNPKSIPGAKKPRCHVRKGDQVLVIAGNNRGKTGMVAQVLAWQQRVILEGDAAVFHTKHRKPNQQTNEKGGRVQQPRPIHISNVALIDPTTGKPTRVRRERKDGKLVRVAKKSGHRFEEA